MRANITSEMYVTWCENKAMCVVCCTTVPRWAWQTHQCVKSSKVLRFFPDHFYAVSKFHENEMFGSREGRNATE